MGKRKPTVPRRRQGAHFVDLTIQRSMFVDARRADTASDGAPVAVKSTAAAAPSVPWFSSAPTPTPSTAGVSASPLPPSTVPPQTTHSTNMHTQQDGATAAATAHLHHISKPTATTVPSLPSAREQSSAPPSHAVPASEETVAISLAQLEAWKQRTILQIEDHFTNEQLKRIAEFGRVHANLVKEAKEYVAGIETQLKEQFERERESLKQQAEAYVSQFQQENEQLRQRVQLLEDELQATEHIQEEHEDADECLDDSAAAGSMTAKIGFVSDAPSISSSGSTGSDKSGDSSLPSHALDASDSYLPNENAKRVDAVTETMSRAMGIRTPRVEAKATTTSPKEALQLIQSPTTTNESSPVDSSGTLLHRTDLGAPALAADDDYL